MEKLPESDTTSAPNNTILSPAEDLFETIKAAFPYVHKGIHGRTEDLLLAQMVEMVAGDVAAAPQNLIRLQVEVDGTVIAGIADNYVEARINREPMWELAYTLAVHLVNSDPYRPENADKKYCSHCGEWCKDGYAALKNFGELKIVCHTPRKSCHDLVVHQRRPLGELMPPHRKFPKFITSMRRPSRNGR